MRSLGQLNLIQAYDPRQPHNSLPHLPPDADIETIAVLRELNSASRALADLNGATLSVPNPNLLVDTFGIKEAQATSEIEGIRTTSDRLFRYMAIGNRQASDATREAARNQEALASGINHLRKNPHLNTALLVGLCKQILRDDVDVRRDGVYIEDSLTGAVIYTPPFGENLILRLLNNLLEFAQGSVPDWDPLIKMAVMHYQFEAIHPFPDGNGRTGRVLNVLYLMQQNLLDHPVLYLSKYFLDNRDEYYEGLRGVTEFADWQTWILYILKAIRNVAMEAREKLFEIHALRKEFAERAKAEAPNATSEQLMDLLFMRPYCTFGMVEQAEGVTRVTARAHLEALVDAGMLENIVLPNRLRLFRNNDLIEILER